MEDLLWKILAFILASILIFLAPLLMFYDRMDDMTYNTSYQAVNEFAQISRELGEVNSYNYRKMLSKLNSTGLSFEIDIEHHKKVYMPVLDKNGLETGEINCIYEGIYDGDIESKIEQGYKMEAGDLFYIQVKNKTRTMAESLRASLFGVGATNGSIFIRSGGMVHSSGE